MVLAQLAAESIIPVQNVVLQFGGDLIGLAILFLVLALITGVLGASGVAGLSMDIAKWLVIIFVVLAVLTFIF
ncbi:MULTISPECIES: DUF1328 domain-containing protein [Haloarcula]|uniref:UPF0391 membrane protein C442_05476 n=1 Tax=Haloarcula amylolytica JCM 13557 TaxID=1227452 RepID=M0KPI7_9EURY|nr:DUF1328 domain-containing protein [Haloarcula amylolytica]EMA23287.1 hypothetical protein C442_05476 [Haloarcula amylolytica JCM 13557]